MVFLWHYGLMGLHQDFGLLRKELGCSRELHRGRLPWKIRLWILELSASQRWPAPCVQRGRLLVLERFENLEVCDRYIILSQVSDDCSIWIPLGKFVMCKWRDWHWNSRCQQADPSFGQPQDHLEISKGCMTTLGHFILPYYYYWVL